MPKVLTKTSAIRDHVRKLKPNRIAVAYVGTDWRQFVDPDAIQEIVLSPTPGSNPWAIEEIIRAIGMRNVHFLDKLHAKFYLAAGRAFLGSANLSNNAFLDERLLEAGVILDDEASLVQLRSTFEEYKALAGKQYPDEKAKHERLEELKILHNSADCAGMLAPRPSPELTNYVPGHERIHITWYDYYESADTDPDALTKAVQDLSATAGEDRFKREFYFHEQDKLREGDWLLCWHRGLDGLPLTRGEIFWMRAHYVIPNGVTDNDYTTLVAQARDRPAGSEPFNLSPATKKAIRAVLKLDRFRAMRPNNQSVWRLAEADRLTPLFLEQVKVALRDSRDSERI